MKNNKGFSLIELIVVIAIMAVVMTFIGLGFGTLTNQNAKSAYKSLYNMLGSTQTIAMSKANCYMIVEINSDGVPVFTTVNEMNGTCAIVEQTKASKNVSISIHLEDDSNIELVKNAGYVITFDRASGSFNDTYIFSGDYTHPKNGTASSRCNKISVSQGSKAYVINLVLNTGKFYVE